VTAQDQKWNGERDNQSLNSVAADGNDGWYRANNKVRSYEVQEADAGSETGEGSVEPRSLIEFRMIYDR
jgi:hypothetical protein